MRKREEMDPALSAMGNERVGQDSQTRINMRAVKALGLTIPQTVLFRADEMIQ